MRLKRAWWAAFCAAAPLMAHAQTEIVWIADAQGCKVENKRPLPNQSVSWSGACRNGFADGRGELKVIVEGELLTAYEGDVKAGRLAGQGVLTTPGGLRYQGNFHDGRYDGQGLLTYSGGTTFQGDFAAGQPEGACTVNWPSGDRYEGQCKAGRPDGSGRVRFANGDTYAGDLAQGQASGQGRYSWALGDSYEGRFTLGQAAGSGEYRFANGSRFVGNFRFGVPWGQGQVQLTDGPGYEGLFELGGPGASGRFTRADGASAQDSPELRAQLRLRYAKARLLESPTQYAAGMVCKRMPKPEMPNVKWKGHQVYKATAIIRGGLITTLLVEPLGKLEDEALGRQFAASIERAVRAYDCPGSHVVEQQFTFASDGS